MNPFHVMDVKLLHFLNVEMAGASWDFFWLTMTQLQRQSWVVFGVAPVLSLILLYKYRLRAFVPLAVTGLAVAITDVLAYRVIKQAIHRLRPFADPETMAWVRKVGEAHGPGFPSNHAANCFAAAAVLSWFFGSYAYIFYILAGLVGLSRIALGVHFPSDVLAGAILGVVVGYLIRILILNRSSQFMLNPGDSKLTVESDGWRSRIRRSKPS